MAVIAPVTNCSGLVDLSAIIGCPPMKSPVKHMNRYQLIMRRAHLVGLDMNSL